ncbi:MAG: hypothetical protein K6G01_05890 [Eubacterium sp.]|nr:hypothetical protein [Eubacterium sp.]
MDISSVNTYTNTYSSTIAANKKIDSTSKNTNQTAATDETTTNSSTSAATDRSAIVNQLKADSEARNQQLVNYVQQMMQQQGATIANADSVWRFLASGDYTVSEAAQKEAQELISEDGYYGVEQTSDRIVEFAKALSGGDVSYAEELLDAFKKGYQEATKSWGQELPEISQKTYDAVLEKFESWKNGTDTTSTTAATGIDYYA